MDIIVTGIIGVLITFFAYSPLKNGLLSQQIKMQAPPLAQVLGISTAESNAIVFDIDSVFTKPFTAEDTALFEKEVTFIGPITAGNIIYSVKPGGGIGVSEGQNPYISNTGVLSLAGKTGSLWLESGTGISLDGLKITNSDIGSGQSIFKTIAVSGQTSIIAGNNSDILNFSFGQGIALLTDVATKTITINSADPNIAAGWTHAGGYVRLTNGTDFVGIGTTSPSSKLDILGVGTEAILSGDELITDAADRDFSSDTGHWTGTNWTVGGGAATHTSGINSFTLSGASFTPVAGQTYQVSFDVNTTTTGGLNATIGGTQFADQSIFGYVMGNQTRTITLTTTTTEPLIISSTDTAWEGSIDNISIKLITLTTATQALRNSDGTIGLELRPGGSGLLNSFIGANAGSSITTGVRNTAFGYDALFSNTSGMRNIALGPNALRNNTTGSYNISIGSGSLFQNNTDFNIAIGQTAFNYLSSGTRNIALGDNAGMQMSVGSDNTFLGAKSGYYAFSLNHSLMLGADANPLNLNGDTNEIVIGDSATGVGSNSVVLGNDSITKTILKGNVGVGTVSPSSKLDILGVGTEAILSGDELVTDAADRDFSSDTGHWTGTNWTVGGDVATHTSGADSFTLSGTGFTPVAGQTYQVSFDINTTVTGAVTATMGGKQFGDQAVFGYVMGSQTKTAVMTATSTDPFIITPTNTSWEGSIDNFSIKLITPATATQALRNSDGSIGLELRSGGSGLFNSFIGVNAGSSITTGIRNTAIGHSALLSNTSGTRNIALGPNSLRNNSTGSYNIAIGSGSLYQNNTDSNIAMGQISLYYLTGGTRNIALGDNAGMQMDVGSDNTFLGAKSGFSALLLDHSLMLGADANPLNISGDTNEIVIGDSATGVGSNSVVLGNDSITKTILKGNVGVGTTSPSSKLDVLGESTEAVLSIDELITDAADRDFSSDTGNWTGTNWTVGGDVATHTSGADSFTLSGTGFTPVAGQTYQISFDIDTTAIGGVNATIGGTQFADQPIFGYVMGNQTRTTIITTTTTDPFIITPADTAWEGSIDNISIKLITLTTATQALRNSDSAIGLELRPGGSGLLNSFIGANAGSSITTGVRNTAFGYDALFSNTAGMSNIALGPNSLRNNSTGSYNIAIGSGSLFQNNTDSNIAMGQTALNYLSSGTRNIALGDNAGMQMSVGSDNTFLGAKSGFSALLLDHSLMLGADANPLNISGDTNEIVIGDSVTGLGSNTVVLGNDSIVTTALQGNVGIGTTSPNTKLELNSGTTDVSGLRFTQLTSASSPSFTNGLLLTVDGSGNVILAPDQSASGGIGVFQVTNGFGESVATRNDSILFAREDYPTSYLNKITNSMSGNDFDSSMNFEVTNGADTFATAMTLLGTGNVGIGDTNPAYILTVNGEPAANGYTAFTNYSDARLKTNIKSLSGGYLDKILALNPSAFNYNSLTGYDQKTLDRTVTGFIAQDLQNIFPEMVGKTTINGIEYLDTNLSGLPIFTIKALQELNTKFDDFSASTSGRITLTLFDEQSHISNLDTRVAELEKLGAITSLPVEFHENALFRAFVEFFDNVLFHKDVTFLGRIIMNKNMGGIATIGQGGDHVDVVFSTPYLKTPIITTNLVTADFTDKTFIADGSNAFVTNVTSNGFSIYLPLLALRDYSYNWIALDIDSPTNVKNISDLQKIAEQVAGIATSSAILTPTAHPSPTPYSPLPTLIPSPTTEPTPTVLPTLAPTLPAPTPYIIIFPTIEITPTPVASESAGITP